jgi:hypothetical protein
MGRAAEQDFVRGYLARMGVAFTEATARRLERAIARVAVRELGRLNAADRA